MAIIEPAQYTRPRPRPAKLAVPNYPLTITPQRPATRQVTVPLNYRALLQGDLALGPTLRAIQTNQLAAQQAQQAADQRARITFGEQTPGGDALTNRLAAENTAAGLSTLAQLQRQAQGAQAASAESLAARGILHSGAYLQHSNANALNAQVQQQAARQQLLDTLAQNKSDFASTQRDLAQQAATATSGALDRITSQINAGTLVPGVRQVTRTRLNPAAPSQVYPGGEPKPTSYGPPPRPRRRAAPHVTPTLSRNSY